jgi:Flp pilus assembly pilin Flp
MDKLRTVATSVATKVARARPLMSTHARSAWATEDIGSERGQGLAEYALILAGIAIVAITSLIFLGGTISDLFWDPISEDFGKVLSEILG